MMLNTNIIYWLDTISGRKTYWFWLRYWWTSIVIDLCFKLGIICYSAQGACDAWQKSTIDYGNYGFSISGLE